MQRSKETVFTPADLAWFIAVQIEDFQVEGEDQTLVYLNNIVIRASSAEIAYTKALEICSKSNQQYQDPDGKTVTQRFRGLADLFPIHDQLEDGAELSFVCLDSIQEAELLRLVRSKEQLELLHKSHEAGDVSS